MTCPFTHPATLLSGGDVLKMQQRVRASLPCAIRGRDKLGWDTKPGYKPNALARVHCMWGAKPIGHAELCDKDAVQAYLQTLSFLLHGDPACADTAIAIVKAWCSTCTAITGDNRILEAAWSTACFARSLELLKHTYRLQFHASGVEAAYKRWVDAVVMPALTAPITWKINGGKDMASNWHAARAEALMQLAVLRDDKSMFDQQVAEFRRILPIIIKPDGMGNEVQRDLMHAQFSLGSLAHTCELAHNATGGRLDLYKELDSRLAKGMEYVAAIISQQGSAAVKDLKMVAWHPAGAWGLSVTAYEKRGVQVPKSRKLLNDNTDKDNTMASDLAHAIVSIAEQQQEAEAAALKARTLRTVSILAQATVAEGDDDTDDPVSFDTSTHIDIYMAAPAPQADPVWVLDYRNARLQVAQASDFIVQCACEGVKLSIHDWMLENGSADIVSEMDVQVTVQLTIGLPTDDDDGEPWCAFRESVSFEDTRLSTWAPPISVYATAKARQLLDVAQHVRR
ncbi:hypothetical protein OEZ85_011066 [Tetradesmus obliquus]|uniref:Alginate lyase domain-containing protein n=1 Tax=Tetradesmus obliquus TaxID=3088 RepID=A0ABY8TP57_TETOB|nr:hypothetical protein OEZ85_011066 [Tetradesmus obliquus]